MKERKRWKKYKTKWKKDQFRPAAIFCRELKKVNEVCWGRVGFGGVGGWFYLALVAIIKRKKKKKQVENIKKTNKKQKKKQQFSCFPLSLFPSSPFVHSTGRWSTTMPWNGLEPAALLNPTPLERKGKEE